VTHPHDDVLAEEFTHQAGSFARSPVANDPQLLDLIVAAAQPRRADRWLDAACGPGIVSRRLARHVQAVHGIDATVAMVDLATREAEAAGLDNVSFSVGDSTALAYAAGSFDGAVTRFAIHHIPLPARLIDELARVVAPGGRIVLVDHLADDDQGAFAWATALERVRDPSHWATLTAADLRRLGEQAGLELLSEREQPMALDLGDWVARGSGARADQRLVAHALAQRPAGTERMRLLTRDGLPTLELAVSISAWRRP
jgi:2-polyprenyl-3-methyl-5-hydroxy-6-metoxy-1,4-benzoquinol methylase